MDKIVEPDVIHCSMISVLVERVVHLQTGYHPLAAFGYKLLMVSRVNSQKLQTPFLRDLMPGQLCCGMHGVFGHAPLSAVCSKQLHKLALPAIPASPGPVDIPIKSTLGGMTKA